MTNMNSSRKLRTIQESARNIVDMCSGSTNANSTACMTSANEIFELAEQLVTTLEMEEHYGLRVEGRKPDSDGVRGSGKVSGTIRYKADPERELKSAHCQKQLAASAAARARTYKARKSRRKVRK